MTALSYSLGPFDILDISQPIAPETAHFPGDVAFSRDISLTLAESHILNLSAFTMSPHVGTHADAPLHISGQFDESPTPAIGQVPLAPYIGPVQVVDMAPTRKVITPQILEDQFWNQSPFPERLLFKTDPAIRYDQFDAAYSHFSPELIQRLSQKGVQLVGIDTPSVDPVDAKILHAHHALLKANMAWLENLDLSHTAPGNYFLVALPLKLTTVDASPVRAVLLSPRP